MRCWYCPPGHGEIQSILDLEVESERLDSDAVSTILMGNMNVHKPGWLRYSAHASPGCTALSNVCINHGLEECGRAPTRGTPHLLDLVLSHLSGRAGREYRARSGDGAVRLTGDHHHVPDAHSAEAM